MNEKKERARIMELQDHEKKHIEYLEKNAGECTLFLKKDGAFPLEKPCTLALYGNGARNTVKGGTGSGDVDSRFFVNFEQGLSSSGFSIITKDWLDSYDEISAANYKKYIKDTKKAAHKAGYMPLIFSIGYFPEEPEYDLPLTDKAEAAVYVLARNSGEGNDRKLASGDVYLSESEIRDILWLDSHYEKFMLVLNTGGVVDLNPVMKVRNILYISQLGVVTGSILAPILLGKVNPSGKLTTTWAEPKQYPSYKNFGDLHDVKYEEGIYVGYRYFDTASVKPLFPFGFGLSYSDFDISFDLLDVCGSEVKVTAKVKNISKVPGKEVVELYVSEASGTLSKAAKQLAAFSKTKMLEPGEEVPLTLTFDLKTLASFSEKVSAYILEKGDYVLMLGNSSDNAKPVAFVTLDETVTVKQCENRMGDPGFLDLVLERPLFKHDDLPNQKIDISSIRKETVKYQKDEYTDKSLEALSDHDLIMLTLGHHGTGIAAMIGDSCKHVVGGAGETSLAVKSVKKSLTMADGPAGLRLCSVYGEDEKGTYSLTLDPMMKKMMDFLPKASSIFIKPPKNRKGEVHYQYTTAIPVGTAIAQSFNLEFAKELGNLVAEEMELFNVDLWLAPALNIHRNILCGRNFEYFSEDPYLSGKMAAAITLGVQAHKGKGVTIKHVLCNNQEINRNNGNSLVSERALREIYLRGFEICIKEAAPKALMTSYNLVNGVHTSESYELNNDILRCELNYNGLIMSDWIQSGRSFCAKHIYPAPYASNNVKAGNDLTMPGAKPDEKDMIKALLSGKLTRKDLLISASRVVRAINDMK